MVMCAKFDAKQTNFEAVYKRKCQKYIKKHKKSNFARIFKNMTIVFDCNHLDTIIYTK